jgi:hypothetical protein
MQNIDTALWFTAGNLFPYNKRVSQQFADKFFKKKREVKSRRMRVDIQTVTVHKHMKITISKRIYAVLIVVIFHCYSPPAKQVART